MSKTVLALIEERLLSYVLSSSAFWPSLLDVPGFLQQFITPIVKVTEKGKKKPKSHTFFSLPQYDE